MSLSQRKRPELATQPRKRKDAARTEVDPQLAFMLARHGMTRWQFDAERFIAVAEGRTGSHRDRMLVLLEAELGMQQIKALESRIESFVKAKDLAVRFEAQEVMAALETVHNRMVRAVQRLQPNAHRRDASQIFASLQARLR